ncbi:hypothetical protein JTE90_020463, partial [Oedothorax gibbosus]
IDSFGKPETGLLQGNLNWLGDFKECTDVYAPPFNDTIGDFHGQYCTLTATARLGNLSLPISIGTCLPDSCHSYEQLNKHTALPQNIKESIFTDIKLTCLPQFQNLTAAAICVIVLISIFIVLALIGSLITIYENFAIKGTSKLVTLNNTKSINLNEVDTKKNPTYAENGVPELKNSTTFTKLPASIECVQPFFNCFCIITNGTKLLDTTESEGQLPCLHGIRFLSLSWVIICHTYGFGIVYVRSVKEVLPMVDNYPFQIIFNGFYAVDSFFLLSGFLLAYIFFEAASKNDGKVPWLYFYIHRYIRLTPVYMIVIGFWATLYPLMGSGPFWTMPQTDPGCINNWWRNVLYINNFYDKTDLCLGWSWYLANDMQFFVISPLFLIALWRWPKVGYSILGCFMTASTIVIFVISYQNKLAAGLEGILVADNPLEYMNGTWLEYFRLIYEKPYGRISPYVIGIGLAYYLCKRKQNNSGENSLITLSLGWLIASSITLTCTFSLYHRHLSNLENSIYNAFNRTCFSLGLAWVMYVCITGQGGIVNRILSIKLFISLSRLTYCAYLIHPIVMYIYYFSLKSLFDFSHLKFVILYFGFLVLSYSAAFITSLLFESPIIRLDKLVRKKLIYSESVSQIFHEKYDMIKVVHDASARISLVKKLNEISDSEIRSLIDELDSFSGENSSPLLTEILTKNDSSDKCVDDLHYTFENLLPVGGWGAKMLDSYAKPERGIFQGNLRWLGDFNECVGVYAPRKTTESNKTVGDFHGQYCTLTVTVNIENIVSNILSLYSP